MLVMTHILLELESLFILFHPNMSDDLATRAGWDTAVYFALIRPTVVSGELTLVNSAVIAAQKITALEIIILLFFCILRQGLSLST